LLRSFEDDSFVWDVSERLAGHQISFLPIWLSPLGRVAVDEDAEFRNAFRSGFPGLTRLCASDAWGLGTVLRCNGRLMRPIGYFSHESKAMLPSGQTTKCSSSSFHGKSWYVSQRHSSEGRKS